MKKFLHYRLWIIIGLALLFVGGMTIALQKQDEVVALLFGEEIAGSLASYQQHYTPAELIQLRIRGQLQPTTTEPQLLLPLITGKAIEETQEADNTRNILEEESILETTLESET